MKLEAVRLTRSEKKMRILNGMTSRGQRTKAIIRETLEVDTVILPDHWLSAAIERVSIG